MNAHKICVLGEFGVGKTSLTRRYVLGEFSKTYRATLGVNLYKYTDRVQVDGVDHPVSLVLWDIEGASLPTAQTERYVLGAAGAIVVGDSSRKDPEQPMMLHAEMFEERAPGRPIGFAFNKSDLVEDPAVLKLDEIERRFGSRPVLTSAATGDGVRDIFRDLARTILQMGL